MERDKHVAVVTDSGSSIHSENQEAKELNITSVVLDLEFWEDNKYVPYSDDQIEADEFYKRMMASGKMLPKTAVVPWRFNETFSSLKEKAESIISINLTSKHSNVCEFAVLAKNTVLEEGGPETNIEVVDSKLISIAEWFVVETAALASKKSATLKEIQDEIAEVIVKTHLLITLKTLENFIKGGRGKELGEAIVASKLHITPVIGLEDGKLKVFEKVWGGFEKGRNKMIEMVGNEGKLVKLAVIHTNAREVAELTKEVLKKIFKGTIPVYEAGPLLGVHAGEGGVGIAFQKA